MDAEVIYAHNKNFHPAYTLHQPHGKSDKAWLILARIREGGENR